MGSASLWQRYITAAGASATSYRLWLGDCEQELNSMHAPPPLTAH